MLTNISESHVLVIEDDIDIRDAIKEALESEGHSVITALHGLEGLNIIKASVTKPRLILLDLNMPVMNGYEFLEHKSQDTDLSAIPVVVFSANPNKKNAPADIEYLQKPTDLDMLLDLVKRY